MPRGRWVLIVTLLIALFRLRFLLRTAPRIRRYDVDAKDAVVPNEARGLALERQSHAAHPNRTVHVVSFHGLQDMNVFIGKSFYGNPFCDTVEALRQDDPNVLILFSFHFHCRELFLKSTCGTGNFLALLYGLRLAADFFGDVELHWTCPDAAMQHTQLVLPWLAGVYTARSADMPRRWNVSRTEACGGAYEQPLGHMVHVIQDDLRRMAVALVGSRKAKRIAALLDQSSSLSVDRPTFQPQLDLTTRKRPPFAKVRWDEAVVHFRCGDLMDSTHWSFAFLNFRGYTRHIAPDVRSIGILTQPFARKTKTQPRRWQDDGPLVRDRCRTVVLSLVDYLHQHFPRAHVRVHSDDSLALSYVRMILAQQVVVGISTFGIMPAIATGGTAYVRVPDYPHEVNQWLVLPPPIDQRVDNVVLIHDPKVPVEYIKTLWETQGEAGVVAWFWNDTWVPEG